MGFVRKPADKEPLTGSCGNHDFREMHHPGVGPQSGPPPPPPCQVPAEWAWGSGPAARTLCTHSAREQGAQDRVGGS